MSISLKDNKILQNFQSLNLSKIKYQTPLILKMFEVLNKLNLNNESRYILCNFIDQYSDLLGIKEDIYTTNNNINLNQLLLLAINKARKSKLLNALFEEYFNSINAIIKKKEI